jgi:hypothetical protein
VRGKGTKVGEGENNPENNPEKNTTKNSGFLHSGLFCSGKVRGAILIGLMLPRWRSGRPLDS